MSRSYILVTGGLGFIGSHVIAKLLKNISSFIIVNVDNVSGRYEDSLISCRTSMIENSCKDSKSNYIYILGDISDRAFLHDLFLTYDFEYVINLAAHAGVRDSIENPDIYIESNVVGFYNVLQECRYSVSRGGRLKHIIYASSSSVYGESSATQPSSTYDRVDNQESLYAVTKRVDELLANCYSKLYNFCCTGLRFFTVYGPAGRPDMFYYKACVKLSQGEKIYLYNNGNMYRDFTYIDDVTESIYQILVQGYKNTQSNCHNSIYNIGSSKPCNLKSFITLLYQNMINCGLLDNDFNLENHIIYTNKQLGDVSNTYSDTSLLKIHYDVDISTDLGEGLSHFVNWYASFKYHR